MSRKEIRKNNIEKTDKQRFKEFLKHMSENLRKSEELRQEDCLLTKYLIDVIEKQIPKKPNIYGDGYDNNGNIIYDMYDCPNCDKSYEIDYEKYDYCPSCGQAIDWSEED